MTDSKEDGLTISVEREDLEDGSITYHLWDTTNGDYKWIVGLNDDKAAQGGKSKFYAERIALAVNALSTPPKPVAGSKEDGLRFADLRRANVERQEHWGGSENWTLADWSNAVAGEVGEACNVVKKIRRPQLGTVGNDADAPKYYAQLESEIGDVLIYLDLLAKAAGFTLDTCVSRAFNEKSEKLGMPVRLSASSPPVGGSGEVVAWRWRAKAKGVWGLWSVVDVDPNDWTWRDYWEDLDIIPLYAAPVPNGVPEGAGAISDIAAERQRQISEEGWTPEHDDQHTGGELAQAAAAYAFYFTEADNTQPAAEVLFPVSWATAWWKPWDRRRNLIKAGALIVAEIERLDRLAASPVTPEGLSGGDGWIKWEGGECPVDPGTNVEIRLRSGEQFFDVAGLGGKIALDWSHGGETDRDIIAYRLVKTEATTP